MNSKNQNNRKINEKKRQEHIKKRKHKVHRSSGEIVRNIILIAAIVVFLYAGFQLFSIFSEYKMGEKEYDKIQSLAIKETKNDKESVFSVDFNALQKMNPDVVAWIRFEEPAEINYPVVQGKDNSEYLHRTFEANDNKLGTLFVDVGNLADFTERNTFIYGHNMKNGTMFAKLLEYKQKEFYEQHPCFYIYTPNGKISKYQVCAAAVIKDDSQLYNRSYDTTEIWTDYLNLMKQTSLYDTKTAVEPNSQIISLSTCTNVADDERFLLQGVKIGEE